MCIDEEGQDRHDQTIQLKSILSSTDQHRTVASPSISKLIPFPMHWDTGLSMLLNRASRDQRRNKNSRENLKNSKEKMSSHLPPPTSHFWLLLFFLSDHPRLDNNRKSSWGPDRSRRTITAVLVCFVRPWKEHAWKCWYKTSSSYRSFSTSLTTLTQVHFTESSLWWKWRSIQ